MNIVLEAFLAFSLGFVLVIVTGNWPLAVVFMAGFIFGDWRWRRNVAQRED